MRAAVAWAFARLVFIGLQLRLADGLTDLRKLGLVTAVIAGATRYRMPSASHENASTASASKLVVK